MATQVTNIPSATIEKLDKECHNNNLDFAQDIARNLLIATQSGESIKGDTGTAGSTGSSGASGADGTDGTDGKTPTPVNGSFDIPAGTLEITDQLPILGPADSELIIQIYWGDTVTPPVTIPEYYLMEGANNTEIKFLPAVSGDSWSVKWSYYQLNI